MDVEQTPTEQIQEPVVAEPIPVQHEQQCYLVNNVSDQLSYYLISH